MPTPPKIALRKAELDDKALTMFDQENPRSFINIVWSDMKPIVERAQHSCREYFKKSERQLRIALKPEPIDDMLRLRVWQEYDRAQMNESKMMLSTIINGLCTRDYWQDAICKNPDRLAWLLFPMAEYTTRMESSLYIGLSELDDILRLPITEKKIRRDGSEYEEINTKLIAEKVKITQWLDLKIKGAIVQKLAIHQKVDSVTHHIGTNMGDGALDRMSLTDLQAIDKSIAMVKRQIEQAQSRELLPALATPEVIDAEIVPAEDSGGD